MPSKRLKNKLSYAEGLSLFETAEGALPYPDKTLLHHKALWIKNEGGDSKAAMVVLEKALSAPPFPYGDRGEANEHIHTSLAATALDALDAGVVTLEEGRDRVLSELAQARSTRFFNPRAAHVEAKLILRLRQRLGSEAVPDQMAMTTSALSNVDRTLLLLAAHVARKGVRSKDIELLNSVRNELLASGMEESEVEAYAEKVVSPEWWKSTGHHHPA